MRGRNAAAIRIAERHNEDVKNSIEASAVGEEVIRRMEDVAEDAYSRATQETLELNQKLMAIAHANTDAFFEWARELVGVTSPWDFIAVSTKHAHERFQALGQQTRELAGLAQKAAIENMGPLGTIIGGALIGRPDLS
jgi:hypothetical protein